MSDFFEIDFLDIDTKNSGDAIPLRYRVDGNTRIHVTDGGFQDTGDKLVEHINKYYDSPNRIDAVVVSHPDGDHAAGLRSVLREYRVDELWTLRPWLYAEELLNRFTRFSNVENLSRRLREIYPNIAELEKIAISRSIEIREPFQGAQIGHFTVMAPTKGRYLDLVVESDKTPEASKVASEYSSQISLAMLLEKSVAKVVSLIRSAWGEETFSTEETTPENNMSVIQYANLGGINILLTADAGRAALSEAAYYAPILGLKLPGIDRFQVPHHGSRRNVSTELLDLWLGPRLPNKPDHGNESFYAIVSATKKDKDHPRKAVVRALIHRGANVISTEGRCICTGNNSPSREGWVAVDPLPYPEEQETD